MSRQNRLLRRLSIALVLLIADTMPLSVRAKLLMAVESISALTLPVLVVSFGDGLLKH